MCILDYVTKALLCCSLHMYRKTHTLETVATIHTLIQDGLEELSLHQGLRTTDDINLVLKTAMEGQG